MALGKCLAVSLHGVLARVINVEANVGHGLPGIHVVGHADTAISESRDRIKTAAANSRLPWPKTKVIVSMSPASLPKSGSHFDLPMALAILAAHVGQQRPVRVHGLRLDHRDGVQSLLPAAGRGRQPGDHRRLPASNRARSLRHDLWGVRRALRRGGSGWRYARTEKPVPGR